MVRYSGVFIAPASLKQSPAPPGADPRPRLFRGIHCPGLFEARRGHVENLPKSRYSGVFIAPASLKLGPPERTMMRKTIFRGIHCPGLFEAVPLSRRLGPGSLLYSGVFIAPASLKRIPQARYPRLATPGYSGVFIAPASLKQSYPYA